MAIILQYQCVSCEKVVNDLKSAEQHLSDNPSHAMRTTLINDLIYKEGFKI